MANKTFVVQYLIKAREQFAAAAEKTRRASDRMRQSIKRAKDEFAAAAVKMRKAGAIMSAAVTAPIAFLANSLKNAARDSEETRSKFATVFRDIAGQSELAAKNLADNFGLSGTKAKQLLSDTGDLLSGFGFTQKSALNLSTQVNKLAVDLASFTNFSGGAEGASAALTKALLGERESLKTLGIAILETDVKAKVSKMLAEGRTFATMRQAKAEATLALALEQSKNAIGDFARTSKDLANQERITSARIQDLKESFGRVLLPIALKVTQAIRGIADGLLALSPGAKKAILIVAGIIAAIGPMLLALGSMALIWPAIVAGFSTVGAIGAAALGPLGVLASALAIAAGFVIANWDKVKAFFSGFAAGIDKTAGASISKLVDSFKESAKIIAQLFGTDSAAAAALTEFSSLGQLIGEVIGTALDTILRGLSGIGAIVGQVIGAITTLDFSQFDIEAIKAEFLGASAEPLLVPSRVDVGVNVGLAKGLEETGAATITGQGARRADVGVMTP